MTENDVRNITDKQPASAARFIITATIEGFPVSIEVEGKADALRSMIERLKAIGAEPPATQVAQVEPTKQNGAPLCSVHGSKMKQGRRGFYCPRKDESTGDYCKETA